MMPPDQEFYLLLAVKIVGLAILASVLHNVLELIMRQSHFWEF